VKILIRKKILLIVFGLIFLSLAGCDPPLIEVEEFEYDLNINIVGEGTVDIIIEVAPLAEKYDKGTVLIFKAQAKEGWYFSHWSGDLTGNKNPDGLAMAKDTVITAHFFEILNEDFSLLTFGEIPQGWTRGGMNEGLDWGVTNSSFAGGEAPEMRFSWNNWEGSSFLETPEIDGSGLTGLELSFKHHLAHWGEPEKYILGVSVTKDGGSSYTNFWSVQPLGNIPAETITLDISSFDGETFNIVWFFLGDSGQIDFWYIDDILVTGTPNN